jgi:hypothetical protein
MPKLTPNIPYDDLGDSHQIAEFSAAWVMESSKSVSYLAISDFRPERCGSTVVRRASFGDIEALAGELPMLSQRSYRVGSEQGIVVLAAAVIDRRYRWVVTLESSIAYGASKAIAVEVDEVPVVPRKVVEGNRGSEGVGDRSAVVEGSRSPRLLIRRR